MLDKPFPEAESWLLYFRNLTILSVFVGGFLYVFEPFGISILGEYKLIVCAGFGSMTFLGAAIYEFSLGRLAQVLGWRTRWTFGKWILNNVGAMLFIALANFFFVRIVVFGFIQWNLLPTMLYSTFVIGIFPIVLLGALLLYGNQSRYQHIADEINSAKNTTGSAELSKDKIIFKIPSKRIRYIEALQNYVQVGYIGTDGKFQVLTERVTLKAVESKAAGSAIVKCHRSFLVNKDAVISVSGNAQGLLLTLSDCENVIPVSRTWVPLFR